jgi:hypothetical protein
VSPVETGSCNSRKNDIGETYGVPDVNSKATGSFDKADIK